MGIPIGTSKVDDRQVDAGVTDCMTSAKTSGHTPKNVAALGE
jgi:hypothetical protein